MSELRVGINTNRRAFEGVYSEAARERITELTRADLSLVPQSGSTEEVARSLEGATVVLSTWGAHPYTAELLNLCPDLKLILYAAGSFKKYVTPELVAVNPTVCTAAHLNAIPTAEFSLMLILAALKDFVPYHRALRTHGPAAWKKDHFGFRGGYYRTTVAILGFGAVSRHLIRLLRQFQLQVIVADDFLAEATAAELGVEKVTVNEAMKRADVVSVHHADVERNWGLVNAETLSLMKDGARLVNTSRGRIINEDDLVNELRRGRITAFLDVTHPEPPVEGHPFYSLENCVLTPHIAGSLGLEVQRMGDYCVSELERWLSGESPEKTIDISNLEFRA